MENRRSCRGLVLVVDDEDDIRWCLCAALTLEGYEVLEAANGHEALACIADRRPDLVISDILMPSLNGREMCRRLRDDPRTRHIPIVLFSSLEPSELAGACGDSYIRKPGDISHLLAEIARLLAHH